MLQVDSRKVKEGDTFLALRSVELDGHDFINDAISRGATEIICEEGNFDVKTQIVPNTREYLANYLKEENKEILSQIKIIGITGTNGKTTTAYLLHKALNNLGIKSSYIGTIGFFIDEKKHSLNNTTPDLYELYSLFKESYLNNVKIIVMEVSSQGISYGRVNGIEFDIGIFTNLTQDHLDFHKTMKNYALTKQQLFKNIKEYAIINSDDDYKKYFLLDQNKNITYGFNSADYKIIDYEMNINNTYFEYKDIFNNKHIIKTKLIGKHNIYNLLTVIIVLKQYGFKEQDIIKTISQLDSPIGRTNIINFNTNKIIIDYAHTPDAIEKIIKTFKEISHNKIITVFGCTGDRDRKKRPIMLNIAVSLSEHVIITSDDLHNESFDNIVNDMIKENKCPNYEIIENRIEAIEKGIAKLNNNDILLILGKGHEEFMIINNKKIPINDKNIVETILKDKTIIYS